MNKLKKVMLGALSVLTLGLFVATGARVDAATAAVDGTYSVTAESFYTFDSSKDPSTKRDPDNITVGIFSWSTGTKTNNYAAYGYKGGSSTTNPTTLSWEHEIIIGGTRKITVEIGTLAAGQQAKCTVYGYSENKTIKINGASKTSTTKWAVTPATETITSGSSFDIEFVTNYALLQIDVVISTDTGSTFYDVEFYDGTTWLHTESVKENTTVSASSVNIPGYWGKAFDKWLDEDGEEFDFNTKIAGNTKLYTSYIDSEYAIKDANSLDVALMNKAKTIFGTSSALTDDKALTPSNFTVLTGSQFQSSGWGGTETLANSNSGVKVASPSSTENAIKFVPSKSGSILVYAKNGSSSSDRAVRMLDSSNKKVESTKLAGNSYGVVEFDVEKDETYYIGGAGGNMYIYAIMFEYMSDNTTASVFAEKNTTGDTLRFVGTLTGITDLANIDSIELILELDGTATAKQIFLTTCYTSVTGASQTCASGDNIYYVIYRIKGVTGLTGTISKQLKVTFTDGSTTLSEVTNTVLA